MAGFLLSDPFGTVGGGFYWTCNWGDTACGDQSSVGHYGIDLVSKTYIDKSCSLEGSPCGKLEEAGGSPPAADRFYRKVYSPVDGTIESISSVNNDQLIIQVGRESDGSLIDGLKIELIHLKPTVGSTEVSQGQELGYFESLYPHLHVGVIQNGSRVDPFPWLPADSNLGPYFKTPGGDYFSLPKLQS